MTRPITVADFFCGAGGFSEGFRMAGFRVVFAVDNWSPARLTHKLNHPDCEHPGLDCLHETKGDITKIDPADIPDTDVIVGSPPCVTFSSSNKAGKADKSPGMELIKAYLRIVAIKKHKRGSKLRYWLMENVPNSMKYTEETYTFKTLGIDTKTLKRFSIGKSPNDIALTINKDGMLFDSAEYGVPQRRQRFVCGEFPLPEKTHEDKSKQITLGQVLSSISVSSSNTKDPVFNFKIKTSEVTDHFYDTTIHRFIWEDAKIKKQNARFYGIMSFPDKEDHPSRTVTATMSSSSRESIIIKKGRGYRSLTVREAASLMSFPINYMFQANSESSKYRLVGNAICPKLSYEFASAISLHNKTKPSKKFYNPKERSKLQHDLRINPPATKIPHNRKPNSNFTEIVPDLKVANFRVEMGNNEPRKGNEIYWSLSIHHATGINNMKQVMVPAYGLQPDYFLKEFLITPFGGLLGFNDSIEKLRKELKTILKSIPQKEIFQQQHCTVDKSKKMTSPREALKLVKEITDENFPEEEWKEVSGEKLFDKPIPIRILVAAYAVLSITDCANTPKTKRLSR